MRRIFSIKIALRTHDFVAKEFDKCVGELG